jgi:hypothetical protein
MWRAGPRLSATTIAQNPLGSVMPPLPLSHVSLPACGTVAAEHASNTVHRAVAEHRDRVMTYLEWERGEDMYR